MYSKVEWQEIICWGEAGGDEENMEMSGRINYTWKSNGEVNIGHENTTMVVWIYDGV